MEIELIRHFATEGNLEKRYIGVTDEEIKAEFVLEHTLKKEENGREEWKPELVIVSPLRRCRQRFFFREQSRLSVSRCGNVILAFLRGRIIRS